VTAVARISFESARAIKYEKIKSFLSDNDFIIACERVYAIIKLNVYCGQTRITKGEQVVTSTNVSTVYIILHEAMKVFRSTLLNLNNDLVIWLSNLMCQNTNVRTIFSG